jgi:hypothetical protein
MSLVVFPYTANVLQYEDVNANTDLRNRQVKYFYDKAKDWIEKEYLDLCAYIIVKDGRADVVSSLDEYKRDKTAYLKDSVEDLKKKIELIRKYALSKRLVARVLEKYSRKTDVKWWDLQEKKSSIKKLIHSALKRKIKKAIETKIREKEIAKQQRGGGFSSLF